MADWFGSLQGLELVFVGFALVGGALTLVRLLLELFGGDADADFDVDTGLGDGDATFGLLSLQGLSAFALMFGLVGYGCHAELAWGPGGSVLGGIAGGLLMATLMAKVFDLFSAMQSSGNIDLAKAVGTEGTVYLTIPARGTGKARIVVQKRLRMLDAVTDDGRDLPTGTPVVVTGLQSGNVLVVRAHGAAEL